MNEIAVEATNPTDVLGRYVRTAAWMGTEKAPKPSVVVPVEQAPYLAAEPVPGRAGTAGDDQVGELVPAAAVVPEDVSPAPRPTRPEPAENMSERELVLVVGQRRWRVRGLEKVTSFNLSIAVRDSNASSVEPPSRRP